MTTRKRSAPCSAGTGSPPGRDTSDACEANSLEIIRTAERYIEEHGRPEPFGPAIAGFEPLPTAERRERAAALLPVVRGLASTDRPQVGHYTDTDVVLDFLAPRGAPAPRRARHLVPRPLPAHEGAADGPRPAADGAARGGRRRGCGELHEAYRADYAAVLRASREPRQPRDARRRPGDRPRARGSACSASARTSRRRASRASSTSTRSTSCAAPRRCPRTPRSRSRRSSGSSTGRSRRPSSSGCRRRSRSPRGSRSSPAAGPGIGRAIAVRLAAEGACVVVADIA